MDLGLRGKVAVVTGAGGAIGGEIAKALCREGASVSIWDISMAAAQAKADEITAASGKAQALECDATDRACVSASAEAALEEFGTIDILINCAGGSLKNATTSLDLSFFDIDPEALSSGIALNYLTAVLPSQEVGRVFAEKESGTILNISSIAGLSPLTRAIAYSNGKAAANSFTQWLAVHMAQEYSPNIRVNAIAPGFMLTNQNRFLLVDEKTGEMTDRGKKIIANVPMQRYGEPSELIGAALWLVSNQASFVTGAVVPVDGGFTAYSGV